MPIQEVRVSSVGELVTSVIDETRKLTPGSFFWFRGHSKHSHLLLPTLLRDNKQSSEVFEREKRLITRFRQRSLPFWPAGYPQNDWEHLFAMQHYGMPTRLLDWSENLFVALHFALSVQLQNEDPPVVWCVDPVAWNRATPVLSEYGAAIQVLTTTDEESDAYRPETGRRRNKSPVAIFGAHNSVRIVAQRGTFMVWGEDVRPLTEFATENQAVLYKFILTGPGSELKADLNALGFGETMVFPELGSLATELSRVEGWRSNV